MPTVISAHSASHSALTHFHLGSLRVDFSCSPYLSGAVQVGKAIQHRSYT